MQSTLKNTRRGFFNKVNNGIKVPHTLVLIFAIIVLVAIATYIVPGGAYERVVTEINGQSRTVVLNGSFTYVENQAQGLFAVMQAPIKGLEQSAEIIAFLFVVGGSFSLITRTKAIDSAIAKVVNIFKGNEILIIPIIFTLFSLGGATFGMTEEAIPFVTILVPLMLALGFDSILAVGISYLGCIVGFATAMLNPFTVGIAQSIAEVPLFSGVEYRTLAWVIATTVGIIFLLVYAKKIKKNPEFSPMYKLDKVKREKLSETQSEDIKFTLAHKIIMASIAVCLVVIIVGVLKLGFWIPEIAAVFLITGLFAAIVGGLKADEMAEAFIAGAKDMIGPAMVIGFAKAIVIIAENAQIIDTILYGLSSFIGKLPSLLAACMMLPVQMFINFFVISGSGQAALTMPILAPLGDLLEISRQTTVLIFQLGDGFSNAIFPTSGVLMACLGMAGVPYSKWFKWILPLQVILFALGIIFITCAMLMGWS